MPPVDERLLNFHRPPHLRGRQDISKSLYTSLSLIVTQEPSWPLPDPRSQGHLISQWSIHTLPLPRRHTIPSTLDYLQRRRIPTPPTQMTSATLLFVLRLFHMSNIIPPWPQHRMPLINSRPSITITLPQMEYHNQNPRLPLISPQTVCIMDLRYR